jgi:curli biogenesis system outer membrane secretion channel CsgG
MLCLYYIMFFKRFSKLLILSTLLVVMTNTFADTSLKRKVAVARFSNETQSGTTFLVDESNDRIGKQASDILSSRLAATNKFLMFERTDKDEIDSEKIISGLKEEGVSVDYLIIGSVSEFGRSTDSESRVFKRTKSQRAFAKVNVRLVDVSTGRIIFSQEGAGESVNSAESKAFSKISAGYDQSLTDKAISAAISSLVSKLVENMTNKPWKSYILSSEDGQYVIAGGEKQGLETGLELFVYQKGKTIKNPQSGAMIELPGKKIGIITIISSYGEDEFSEISFATLTDGELNDDFSNYYISDK